MKLFVHGVVQASQVLVRLHTASSTQRLPFSAGFAVFCGPLRHILEPTQQTMSAGFQQVVAAVTWCCALWVSHAAAAYFPPIDGIGNKYVMHTMHGKNQISSAPCRLRQSSGACTSLQRHAVLMAQPIISIPHTAHTPSITSRARPPLHSAQHPTWGSTGAEFYAPRGYFYEDLVSTPRAGPSARVISNELFGADPKLFNSHGISMVTAAWGQFIAHDMLMTGPASPTENMQVPVPVCDARMDELCTGPHNMSVWRNQWIAGTGTSRMNPRKQQNGCTSFIDASTVYGFTAARTPKLRQPYSCKLLADPVNGAPVNVNGETMAGDSVYPSRKQRLTGDPRGNENPGLLSIQSLFVLEHNRQCDVLVAANPTWDADRAFNEARKRVIALIQHITVTEYVPALLGKSLAIYAGYNSGVNPGIDISFGVAAYRYGHSGIPSVYLCREEDGSDCQYEPLLLRNVYFRSSYVGPVTIAQLLRGLVAQPESGIDTVLVDEVRNFLLGLRQDLAAIDIQRGRDFGLPSFAQARILLGLPPPTSFADITDNTRVQLTLASVYNNDVLAVDLWVGGLAEEPQEGAFVGPTFAAIIEQQFTRSRDGDRWWYENRYPVPGTSTPYFSDAELEEIETTRLSDVIHRNTDYKSAPDSAFRVPSSAVFWSSTDASNSNSSSQTSSTDGTRTVTPSSAVSLSFAPIQPGDASFTWTITLQGTGWVGMGLGETMADADIVVVASQGDGTVSVQDRYSASFSAPMIDTVQDVELVSGSVSNGVLTATLRRALDTGDEAQDAVISSTGTTQTMLFAWNSQSNSLAYHSQNRAIVAVNLWA